MGDHASPGRGKPQSENLCTHVRARNPDAPHAKHIKHQRQECLSASLHHALYDNRDTVKRFGNGHHFENRCAETDHLRIRCKDPHQRLRKDKQQRAREDHQADFKRQKGFPQFPEPFPVPGAKGVSCQGGCRRLHAPSRNVKTGFNGIGNRMGGC